MCVGYSLLHHVCGGIERVEPHGALEMLDGKVGLLEPDLDPAAQIPAARKIWIESKRSLHQSVTLNRFTEDCDGPACPHHGKGVVPPEPGRLMRQPHGFAAFFSRYSDSRKKRKNPAIAGQRIGLGIAAVELDGPVEQVQRSFG